MLEIHLKQPWFTFSACWVFTKHKERIRGHSRYAHQNELDKACFHHDMAYGVLKI